MIRELEAEQWVAWENIFEDESKLMKQAQEELGVQIIEVGREDLMAARTLCAEELWGAWAADVQSQGLPAYEVLGKWIELNQENVKLRPPELTQTFESPF